MEKIRVATIQLRGSHITSLKKYEEYLEDIIEAAGQPELIVLPEYAMLPLLQNLKGFRRVQMKELYDGYFNDLTEPMIQMMSSLCFKHATHILVGSHWYQEGSKSYNAAFFFDYEGGFKKFPKFNPTPPERAMIMEGGTEPGIVELPGGIKAGINICLDVEFPENARKAAMLGADILLVPSLTVNQRGASRVEICARSRAVENQMYVVTSTNQTILDIPEEKPLRPMGNAGIFGPVDNKTRLEDGVISKSTKNGDDVIIADLDLSILDESRYESEAPLRSLLERIEH